MKQIPLDQKIKPRFKPSLMSVAVRNSIFVLGFAHASAQAASITVTSLSDFNLLDTGATCTLREAVESINEQSLRPGCVNSGAGFGANDTITVSAGLNNQTITLAGQEITIGDAEGVAVDVLLQASNVTVNANAQSRVFSVTSQSRVSIDGLNFQNGHAIGSQENLYAGIGGAIFVNPDASLSLSNSTVSNNYANYGGGALFSFNAEGVSIENSHFSGNLSARGGGAVFVYGEQAVQILDSEFSQNRAGYLADGTASSFTSGIDGGAISALYYSNVTIADSTISANRSRDDGGAVEVINASVTFQNSVISENVAQDNGGAVFIRYGGLISAKQSTFSSNTALTASGGAISSYNGFGDGVIDVELQQSTISGNSAARDGGGIEFSGRRLTVSNSTISGNSAAIGGGIQGERDISLVELINSTVNNNSATSSGGISIVRDTSLSLINSIVANSVGGDCNLDGTITIDSATLIEDASCNALRFGDPGLLDLADNGGPTLTHALQADSPAINSGLADTCLEFDQRGERRDSVCDIGAFESNPVSGGNLFVIPLPNGKTVMFEL